MKPIPNLYRYYATGDGRIYSLRTGVMVEIKQRLHKGYQIVTLGVGVSRHRLSVHRLVAMAFHGYDKHSNLEVRHLDGNCLNNNSANLAWGTRLENVADAIRHGTIGKGMCARRRKLDTKQILEIKSRFNSGDSASLIASDYGVDRTYIYKLNNGERWSHLNG